MEEDLVARLGADATIAGLCGVRISWFGRQRADVLPALALTKVSPGREYDHDGADGLDNPRVQVDCWTDDPDDLLALRDAVLAEMEASATTGGTTFHPATLEGEGWDEEVNPDGGQRLFRARLDFRFFHEE